MLHKIQTLVVLALRVALQRKFEGVKGCALTLLRQ